MWCSTTYAPPEIITIFKVSLRSLVIFFFHIQNNQEERFNENKIISNEKILLVNCVLELSPKGKKKPLMDSMHNEANVADQSPS